MSRLPAWGQDDLPEPLPFTIRNVFSTIGPGAILLAASIGGGEWLVGPATAVKHGVDVFWIATTAIILQLFFNLEAIRYTLYTGEPMLTGFMRLKPGSLFWGGAYTFITIVQLGVPALARGCAPVLFALFFGGMPGEKGQNDTTLIVLSYVVMALGVGLLMSGGKIERTLERVSWAMIAYIFVFLTFVNVWYIPLDHSLRTLRGFFMFGTAPIEHDGKIDMLLLATLAATAGSGGIGNLIISNWVRDKGFGMGGKVGAIGSAFAGVAEEPSHVGKVFPLTETNLARWRTWWKYVEVDQIWLWALGCFLGMFLNVNLALAVVDPSLAMDGPNAGAYQAEQLATKLWGGLWYLGLINGFWILFSTHLGNTDAMVRNVTDILWTADPNIRRWKGGISRIYYTVLLLVTVFGGVALLFGRAMELFKFLGFMANLVLAVGAIQILVVNSTLLPKPLQPTWWRKAMLVVCFLFYGTSTCLTVRQQIDRLLTPAAPQATVSPAAPTATSTPQKDSAPTDKPSGDTSTQR